MNFHDTREFPAISTEAVWLLKTTARKACSFSAGAESEFKPWSLSHEAEREFQKLAKAAGELPDAGYADIVGSWLSGRFTVRLTAKGAALAKYLLS